MARIDWGNHTINFFAVLFSVFLAFYLTEKAEEWKARSELDEILSALIEDLESDQRTYKEYQIPQNQNHVTDLGYVIEHLVTGKRDSVEAQLGAVLSVDNYSPVSSTYLSIKNSGKLELIEDLRIRKELSRYYDVYGEEALMRGQMQVEYLMNEVMPLVVEHGDLVELKVGSLPTQKRFTNCLVFYQSLVDNKTVQYQELASTAEELGALLFDYQGRQ